MSHELRTPLSGILGMLQLLLASPVTRDQREQLEMSLEASRHLLRVVNDILELSSIESGRLRFEVRPFSLRRTLRPVLHNIETQARTRGLRLSLEVDPDAPESLFGDDTRLRQVLLNLLGNAVKFTDAGTISLRVRPAAGFPERLGRKPFPGEVALLFEVADTGIGIAASKASRVFDNFTLGEDYLSKSRGGSGLGLAISRRYVEAMGGTIWVESAPGRGSVFRFTAFFRQPDAAADPASPAGAEAAGDPASGAADTPSGEESGSADGVADGLTYGTAAGPDAARGDETETGPSADGDAGFGAGSRSAFEADAATAPGTADLFSDHDSVDRSGAAPFDLSGAPGSAEPPVAPPASSASPDPAAPPRRLRVLACEDEAVNLLFLRQLLTNAGHEAVTAHNGREAVERLGDSGPFDIVLLDIQMPLLNGIEVVRRLRAGEIPGADPGLPVIGLSAYAADNDERVGKAAGMDDYVSKPYEARELLARLDALTVRRRF